MNEDKLHEETLHGEAVHGDSARLERAAGSSRWQRLEDVGQRIAADSLNCWDTVVARQDLALKDGCLSFDQNGEERRLTPTSWATGQLCAWLGIPAPYFRKCPTVLQDVQANFWMKAGAFSRPTDSNAEIESYGHKRIREREGEPTARRWLLRARGETLRAVLSERYCALDNNHLMVALRPMLDSRLRADWFALSDEGLHLRIIDPERAREVLRGDELSVGIHIANSEVGFRALTVDALVYRLVCSNGLIRLVKGKSLLRQRHIHIQTPRFAAALEEAIGAAWREADGFIEQMRRTTVMPVQDVEGTLHKLGERWNLSEPVRGDLLQSLRREPSAIQETVYGLVNAMTNVAQRLPDESRYDMEVLAGHLAQNGLGAYGLNAHGVDQYAPKRRATSSGVSVESRRGEGDGGVVDMKTFEPSWSDSHPLEAGQAAEAQSEVEQSEAEFASNDSLTATGGDEQFDPVAIATEMFEVQEVHRQPSVSKRPMIVQREEVML